MQIFNNTKFGLKRNSYNTQLVFNKLYKFKILKFEQQQNISNGRCFFIKLYKIRATLFTIKFYKIYYLAMTEYL